MAIFLKIHYFLLTLLLFYDIILLSVFIASVVQMLLYRINSKKVRSHFEYGIDVLVGELTVKSIDGISDNHNDIIKIVEMCNELQVELCHLDYIIEDYLTDFCV